MSKYIKLEDAIHNINLEVTGRKEYTGDMKANLFFALDDLPTIDIVNCIECVYRGDDWWCYKHEFTPIPIEDYFCKDGERIEE